jgi:lysophospholipase
MKMRLHETEAYKAPAVPDVFAVTTPDRAVLRVARWEPEGEPRGTVVLMQGRAEFIERNYETISDLLDRSFAVICFDWRGQGGSSRSLPNRAKGHIRRFAEFCTDLLTVLDATAQRRPAGPLFGMANSMGGMVLLTALADEPSLFDAAILMSPMLGITVARRGTGARFLAASLMRLRLGKSYAPGQRRPGQLIKPFEGNPLTHDQRRFDRNMDLLRVAPDLGLGAPTVSWVHQSFRQIDFMTQPAIARRISTPVLAFAARNDRVTYTPETERFCRHLPDARFVIIEDAGHELLMETDEIRAQVWAEFDRFMAERFDEAAPTSAAQAL